jgi:hypothetical protein
MLPGRAPARRKAQQNMTRAMRMPAAHALSGRTSGWTGKARAFSTRASKAVRRCMAAGDCGRAGPAASIGHAVALRVAIVGARRMRIGRPVVRAQAVEASLGDPNIDYVRLRRHWLNRRV